MRGIHVSRFGREERYDSSYELRRFRFLDACPQVVDWTRNHRISILYVFRGRRHRYQPDILIHLADGSVVLEEVKGHTWDRLRFQYKNMAAQLYCRARGMTFRVVFKEGLERP